MDNALNEKLDLSALHLGIISVGALLGAVVTLVACILAVRIITVLLRRVLGKTTLEQRVSKYIVSTVRFVLWGCHWRYRTCWPTWRAGWYCW